MESFSKILKDKELYTETKKKYLDLIREDISARKEMVLVKLSKHRIEEMKISNFITNLILFKPFCEFQERFIPDFLFDCSEMNSDTLEDYMDRCIVFFMKREIGFIELSECLASIIEELDAITIEFNILFGNSISLYDEIQLAKRRPDYKKLLNYHIDSNMSFEEIEHDLKDKTDEMIDILKEEPNNFQPYLKSKTGINIGQLTQYKINIGPKPDLEGNVYSIVPDTNFLMGMKTIQDYYIDCSGGRKSSIINNSQVKKAGYTTRKLTFLCTNTLLMDVKDCHTPNHMPINVTNKNTLNRISNRFYLDDDNVLKEISRDDTHLIGKTIRLRSPITCALPYGMCETCYGTLPNKDIHIGILGVLILTSQLTQTLLSSKHLLKTVSEKIEFTEKFLKYFYLESNIIYNKTNYKLDNHYLIINKDDIIENDDEENNKKMLRYFKIRNSKTGKEVSISLEKDLIISEELEELMEERSIMEIPFKSLNGIPLFYIIIENDELSKYLNEILNLIDKNKYLEPTKEKMLEKFNLLLDESKLKINLVHVENIIRELIRDPENECYRPDFSKKDPDYTILRMSDANIKSPAVLNGLSFEHVKKQLSSVDTYKKKEKSFLDDQF